MADIEKKKIIALSGGMKRRVGIAQALLNEPELLIMDEPTAGLDPGERVKLRNYISEFSRDRIVLISTHIVSDIENIASQTLIMKEGKIITKGTTDDLLKIVHGKIWYAKVKESEIFELERKVCIVNQRIEADGKVSIKYLADEPIVKDSISSKGRLEDVYMWLFPEESEADNK